MNNRINEIDVFRGLAVILMIIFHIFVDLQDFFGVTVNYQNGFIYMIGRAAAFTFIFVSGVSAVFSRNNLKNAAYTFAAGLLISISTYLFNPATFVVFGILQFLSFCMLSYHFLKGLNPYAFIFFAVFVFAASFFIEGITVAFPYLIPFGIYPKDFQTVDYYPIFPYIALFFIGNFAGRTVYKERKALLPDFDILPLRFLGKHSLIIYLLHQPLIFGILYLLFLFI